MIFFIILCCFLALAIFSAALLYIERQKIPADVKDPHEVLKNTKWYKCCWASTVMFFGILIGLLIALGCTSSEANRLYDEADTLNLYVDTVSASDNEYMRYHFWNEVMTHNRTVDNYKDTPDNKWYGWFILNDEKYENLPYVNFTLNGGE